MPFTLAWLDSSERERRRALDVIDLFDQPETVDELGLGTVRDTIADVLSPGTSTIQTRARYFFFIPWVYQRLETRSSARGNVSAAARRSEVELIDSLARSADTNGVIGIASRATLRRLPSEIYWSGLGRLGFRLFQGSRAQYHRVLERNSTVSAVLDDVNDVVDGYLRGNWHPHIPAAPTGFPQQASLALTKAEAEFLHGQIELHARSSLLAFLVAQGNLVGDVASPWTLPETNLMEPELARWISDGRCYSQLMLGAQLLYNFLLAEKKQLETHVAEYAAQIEDWRESVVRDRAQLVQWDRPAFWDKVRRENPRLPRGAWRFSEDWITSTLQGASLDPVRDGRARDLVSARERELKGPRARLFSQAHLDLWRGASNLEPLNYRWWVTRRMVDDIVTGLRAGA